MRGTRRSGGCFGAGLPTGEEEKAVWIGYAQIAWNLSGARRRGVRPGAAHANFTTIFPMFCPSNSPMKAATAFSRPLTTVSLFFNRPDLK